MILQVAAAESSWTINVLFINDSDSCKAAHTMVQQPAPYSRSETTDERHCKQNFGTSTDLTRECLSYTWPRPSADSKHQLYQYSFFVFVAKWKCRRKRSTDFVCCHSSLKMEKGTSVLDNRVNRCSEAEVLNTGFIRNFFDLLWGSCLPNFGVLTRQRHWDRQTGSLDILRWTTTAN